MQVYWKIINSGIPSNQYKTTPWSADDNNFLLSIFFIYPYPFLRIPTMAAITESASAYLLDSKVLKLRKNALQKTADISILILAK